MVRKYQIHATAVNVEVLAQIFAAHGCTFAVPAGKALAPGRRPAHDVFGLCLLPECKVHLVTLLAYTVQFAAGIVYVLQIAA